MSNRDFMQGTPASRSVWLDAAVLMTGHVIFLRDEQQGRCIWDWYYNNPDAAQDLIYRSMEAHPDSTPTGVLIALMQRECGTLMP